MTTGICIECTTEFILHIPHVKVCPDCKVDRRNRLQRERRARKKLTESDAVHEARNAYNRNLYSKRCTNDPSFLLIQNKKRTKYLKSGAPSAKYLKSNTPPDEWAKVLQHKRNSRMNMTEDDRKRENDYQREYRDRTVEKRAEYQRERKSLKSDEEAFFSSLAITENIKNMID